MLYYFTLWLHRNVKKHVNKHLVLTCASTQMYLDILRPYFYIIAVTCLPKKIKLINTNLNLIFCTIHITQELFTYFNMQLLYEVAVHSKRTFPENLTWKSAIYTIFKNPIIFLVTSESWGAVLTVKINS